MLLSINLLHCICMAIFEPNRCSFQIQKKVIGKSSEEISEVSLKISFWSLLSFSDKKYIKVLFRKKMAESPCFASILLLEESFVVTYYNSRVSWVNSFQTSLFSPKFTKFIFWSTKGSCLTYFNKKFYVLQEHNKLAIFKFS